MAIETPASEERSSASARTRKTRVGWLAHVELTLGEWEADGVRLGLTSKGSNWWLGDWARFGANHYGQHYRLAAMITGYDEQTLMNMAYVSGRFGFSRRREKLSWSHHAEVAALPEGDQDRWLDLAVGTKLSVRRLRGEIRAQRTAARAESRLEEGGEPAAAMTAGTLTVACPHCGEPVEVQLPIEPEQIH